MSGNRVLSVTLLSSFLVGCVVGPHYRQPAPPSTATANFVSIAPGTNRAPPVADWEKLYDDPLLDQYVDEALRANYDLRAAQAHLAAARAILEAARSARLPATGIDLGGVYGRDVTTDQILEIDGLKPQTVWQFDDMLDVSYELDLFGHVRRSIEAARADQGVVEASRDAVAVTVVAETARAYGLVCSLGEELDVANEAVVVSQQQLAIIRSRRAAGAGADLEVTRQAAFTAQARTAPPPLEGQRRAALFQLTALLGKAPTLSPFEALRCKKTPQLRSGLAVGDGASLLRRRPDIRNAELRLAAATARVGVSIADLYPRITLSGFFGGAATSLSGLATEPGLAWGVGPSVTWSFPNQSLPRARVRHSKASAEAALDDFDSAVLQALKEVEQALSIYDGDMRRRAGLQEAFERSEQAFAIAQKEKAAGATTALELLTAEQTTLAAHTYLTRLDQDLIQDQITIFKALGGSWYGRRHRDS